MILRRVREHFYKVVVQSVVELALQMPGKLGMVEIAGVNGEHVGVNGDGGILQVDQNFYGAAPRYSYWNGCSTGGRQGLKEAQKFPADYDGIIAGAPANYQTHLHVWSIWVAQQVNKTPDSFLPPEKLTALHQAVVAACDAQDGVKDGLVSDPTRCHFDPKTIECKGEDLPNCLKPAQSMRK